MTGLLATCGLVFRDWSASYRLFSQQRCDPAAAFRGVRTVVLEQLAESAPLCLAIDDTLLRKSGRKIHGVAWRRDPLGPPFQTNLVRAQRFLQFSAAVPATGTQTPRMIPIAFTHAPSPAKPPQAASATEQSAYREQARRTSLPAMAAAQLRALEQEFQADARAAGHPVHVLVDGGYTNRTLLRRLPAGFTLIGRIRKDAKLHWLPEEAERAACGRRPRYGAPAPTPEKLRTDESIGWQTVAVIAAGATHQCRVKTMGPVLWRVAGAARLMRVVVIAPLRYRKAPVASRPTGKILYRDPAFLICTDAELPVADIVQQYFWRWDIEVNFREEKSLLGVGQAQVRHAASVQTAPALIVSAYAVLLLAARRCAAHAGGHGLPLPKWRRSSDHQRTSTQQLIHQLRGDAWGRSIGLDSECFSDFAAHLRPATKPEKPLPSLPSAVLYCNA